MIYSSSLYPGEPHMEGEPGDLKFVIRIQKYLINFPFQSSPLLLSIRHSRFERKSNDLYTNLTITLQDALNGFEVSFPHLDGHNVSRRNSTRGMIIELCSR